MAQYPSDKKRDVGYKFSAGILSTDEDFSWFAEKYGLSPNQLARDMWVQAVPYAASGGADTAISNISYITKKDVVLVLEPNTNGTLWLAREGGTLSGNRMRNFINPNNHTNAAGDISLGYTALIFQSSNNGSKGTSITTTNGSWQFMYKEGAFIADDAYTPSDMSWNTTSTTSGESILHATVYQYHGLHFEPDNNPSNGDVLKYTLPDNGNPGYLEWGSGGSSSSGENNEMSFKNIAVSGQNTVVADTTTDTLNLVGGTNVTITTNATTDTITFNATGGISLSDITVGTEGTPSGNGSISYDGTTGVITYTPPAFGLDDLTDVTGGEIPDSFLPEIPDDKLPEIPTDKLPTIPNDKLNFNSSNGTPTGVLPEAQIPNINLTTKVTGTLPVASGGTGINNFSDNDYKNSNIVAGNIPSLDAAKIATGSFDSARIPNLDAAKITSGEIDIGRIPVIPAGNIGSPFNASKITHGTLTVERGGTGITDFSEANFKNSNVTASDISDFDTEVSNNANVAANTLKQSFPGFGTTSSTVMRGDTELTDLPDYNAFATNLNNKMPKAGGTFTGAVTFNENITIGANKTIDGVDISARDAVLTSTTTTANAAMPKSGGEFTGNITLASNVTIAGIDIATDVANNTNKVSFPGFGTTSGTALAGDTTTITAQQATDISNNKTKLSGIDNNATANDTDANLKNRANHTGSQAISTITNLQTSLDGKLGTGDAAASVAYSNITDKPPTFPPTLGTTSSTALAGNTPTISSAQAIAIASNTSAIASKNRVFIQGSAPVGSTNDIWIKNNVTPHLLYVSISGGNNSWGLIYDVSNDKQSVSNNSSKIPTGEAIYERATADDWGVPEGTAIQSTGETGGTKFLRENGDGTCSWQTVSGGSNVTDIEDLDNVTKVGSYSSNEMLVYDSTSNSFKNTRNLSLLSVSANEFNGSFQDVSANVPNIKIASITENSLKHGIVEVINDFIIKLDVGQASGDPKSFQIRNGAGTSVFSVDENGGIRTTKFKDTSGNDKIEYETDKVKIHDDIKSVTGKFKDNSDVTRIDYSGTVTKFSGDVQHTGSSPATISGPDADKLKIESTDDLDFKIASGGASSKSFKFYNNTTEIASLASNGELQIDGDLVTNRKIQLGNSDTTIERTAAGRVSIEGKEIVTVNRVLQQFNLSFSDDIGTTQHYLSWRDQYEQSTSINSDIVDTNYLVPANGRVKCVYMRLGSRTATSTMTVRVYSQNAGFMQSQAQQEAEASSITSSDDFEVFAFYFDNAEHFQAGDSIKISVQDSVDSGGTQIYNVTAVLEFDYTQMGRTDTGELA